MVQYLSHGVQYNFNIPGKGDMPDIVHIQPEFLLPGDRVAAVDLRKPRETGTDIVAMALLGIVAGQVLHQQGPGADDGHIALEDVPKLRQLVKAGGAEGAAELRQAQLVGQQLAVFVPRVRHGAEFIHFEYLLVLTGALLTENDGTAQLCPHQNGHDQQHRGQHDEGTAGEKNV